MKHIYLAVLQLSDSALYIYMFGETVQLCTLQSRNAGFEL